MKKLKKLAMGATILVALMVIFSCAGITPTTSARADATITNSIYVTNWVGGPLGPGETWAGWKYQAASRDGDKAIKWRPVILLPEGESRVAFRSKLTGNTVWEQHFRDTRHLVPNVSGQINRSAPGTVRRFGQHVGVAPAPLATTTSSSLGPMLRLDGAKKKVDVIKSIFIKKGWCGNITSTIKKDDNYVGVFVDGVYQDAITTTNRILTGACKAQIRKVKAVVSVFCDSPCKNCKRRAGVIGIPCQDIEGGVQIGGYHLPIAKRCDNPGYSKGVPMVSLKAQFNNGEDEDWPVARSWQTIIIFRNGNPEELLTTQVIPVLEKKLVKIFSQLDWLNAHLTNASNGDNACNVNISQSGKILLDEL